MKQKIETRDLMADIEETLYRHVIGRCKYGLFDSASDNRKFFMRPSRYFKRASINAYSADFED